MSRYVHIVYADSFTNESAVSAYLASKLGLEYIRTGHLFGRKIVEDRQLYHDLVDGAKPRYPVFEELVIQAVAGIEKNILVPDDPGFLEDVESLDTLLQTLRQHDVKLAAIWYVQNSDLHKTIEESINARGKSAIYPPGGALFMQVADIATDNMQKQHDLMVQINAKYPVNFLSTDVMIGLTESTRSHIDKYLR